MAQSCRFDQWSVALTDDRVVAALQAATGLSDVACRVLAARGMTTPHQAERFLSPSLDRDWHDPHDIPGMRQAAQRVAEAIARGEKVLIFGDFDLDGVSAAAVAARGLSAMGGRVSAIVPHRAREGYGLTEAAIERILGLRPDLVVTVDCGVSSAAEVARLSASGVDVVVTDHHEPGSSVPASVPVANPKLAADGASRDLAGAGVALKLIQAVGSLAGHPDVWRSLTDLAALGTVADIVPLVDENRALVAHGIASIKSMPRVCIASLCAVAGVSLAALGAETIGFSLAPRLNAAGRMDDPQLALDLLLTDDPSAADDLARSLDGLNRDRQWAESDLADAATALAERTYAGERALVLAGEGWNEGVKGIVASRLAKVFDVPTFLFTVADGVAKGSARSVGDVDLFAAVSRCSGRLERFGGHAKAMGLTLAADDLEAFRQELLEVLDGLPGEQFVVRTTIDARIELGEVSVELGAELDQLEPFGHANRRPLLAAESVFMTDRGRVGRDSSHLKFTAYDGSSSVPAIAFRCPDIHVYSECDAAVDLAFQIEVDEWRGRRRAQMIVRDLHVRESGAEAPARELVDELFARADEILAREDYAGIEDAPSFHTKLAGVTFEGRQEVVERLEPATPLRIVRQPDNEYDSNACALFEPRGAQVGFLNRRLAAALAPAIDAGVEYDVEVTGVTGGGDGRSLGINVLLVRRDLCQSADEVALTRAERRAHLQSMSPDELESALVSRFIGDRELHGAQVEALGHLAAGRSTLAVMATGRGKSLIFHLHAARLAVREGVASVFVYPLRALVADQAFHLDEVFSEVGVTVRTVTGESSQTERDEAFAALSNGTLDIVLTTPEFLHFHAGRFAEAGTVGFVVVDEAHHVGMSRSGHRPAYGRLGEALEMLGSPTVLAVTATAPTDVTAQVRDTLGIEAVVLDPTVRDNLVIADSRSRGDKDANILSLASRGDKLVVYVNSRDSSVRLARLLRKRLPELAWRTAFYNGGLSRSVRHAVERAFRNGDISVVVATSAFGEGVNIPDIRDVVLYHLPFNDVEFNQMAGRAGRDGAQAAIHLLFGDKDARINERILEASAPSREDLASLYRVLRDLSASEGDGFEITNAELAERCVKARRGCALDERGVSSGLGVFRELGLVVGEGHGAYRRLTVVADAARVDLESSVRYAEGLDEIAEFAEFREWVLSSPEDVLLRRFNRPILPDGSP